MENYCIPEADRGCVLLGRMFTAALMNMIEALQKSTFMYGTPCFLALKALTDMQTLHEAPRPHCIMLEHPCRLYNTTRKYVQWDIQKGG